MTSEEENPVLSAFSLNLKNVNMAKQNAPTQTVRDDHLKMKYFSLEIRQQD